MSENTNPLTDFIEGGDDGNSLFDVLPFPAENETIAEEPKTAEANYGFKMDDNNRWKNHFCS